MVVVILSSEGHCKHNRIIVYTVAPFYEELDFIWVLLTETGLCVTSLVYVGRLRSSSTLNSVIMDCSPLCGEWCTSCTSLLVIIFCSSSVLFHPFFSMGSGSSNDWYCVRFRHVNSLNFGCWSQTMWICCLSAVGRAQLLPKYWLVFCWTIRTSFLFFCLFVFKPYNN